jgi:hypothetical protein
VEKAAIRYVGFAENAERRAREGRIVALRKFLDECSEDRRRVFREMARKAEDMVTIFSLTGDTWSIYKAKPLTKYAKSGELGVYRELPLTSPSTSTDKISEHFR